MLIELVELNEPGELDNVYMTFENRTNLAKIKTHIIYSFELDEEEGYYKSFLFLKLDSSNLVVSNIWAVSKGEWFIKL